LLLKKQGHSSIFITMINITSLRKLYNKIDIYDINDIAKIDVETVRINNTVSKALNNRFVADKIRDYASNCNKCLKISINSYNITFNYYYHDALQISMVSIFTFIKQFMIARQYLKIDKQFNVHIVCCSYKRFLPQKDVNMSSENINGGFTNRHNNDIYVFRIEEYTKVVLHELIHHCKEVHSDDYSREEINKLKTAFNISHETLLIPNESIVELWAVIFSLMFLSFETRIPYHNLLKFETNFSLTQAKKILKKQANKKWEETTNAYVYIVFKTIYLLNLKRFIEGCVFPYKDNYITNFLIDNKHTLSLKSQKCKTLPNNSLRMTRLF